MVKFMNLPVTARLAVYLTNAIINKNPNTKIKDLTKTYKKDLTENVTEPGYPISGDMLMKNGHKEPRLF